MAYNTDGNLARKLNYQDNRQYTPYTRGTAVPKRVPEMPLPYDPSVEREKRRVEIERQRKRYQFKQLHRAAGLERRKRVVVAVAIVGILAALFGMIVYRHGKIVENNFANTGLTNQINELKVSNVKAKEALLNELDMEKIARDANEKFGLRKPAQSQKIHVTLPDGDKVTVYDKGRADKTADIPDSKDLTALESFMQLRQDGN